jgi:hypothetical protein
MTRKHRGIRDKAMKIIESPVAWVILLLVAAFGVAIMRRSGQRDEATVRDGVTVAPPKEPGFREFVKDPQLWQKLVEQHDDVNRETAVAKGWNDEQVARAVRRFVLVAKSSRDAAGTLKVLQGLGQRTHPELLRILRDPGLRSRLVRPTGENLLPEAPFNRICELASDQPPMEMVALMTRFLDDQSPEIRKDAALVIASTGVESAVVPIRKAFADDDEYVRAYALMGLGRAIEGKRLSEPCRRELLEDIQRLITEGNDKDASKLLLQLDREKARQFFLSDAQLSLESASLHENLRVLNDAGIPVPRERVVALIASLEGIELKYPRKYQLAEALRALGKHQDREDRLRLEKHLLSSEKTVAEGAAAGMLASHGLEGFRERIWKLETERGRKALSPPQRNYSAVFMLDAEVRNGGFSQYFFNSSGDEWRAALAGLEAMQSREYLGLFRDALAKFGAAGPSESRDERMHQLAKVENADEKAFDKLESQYYKSAEVLEVLAMRYVIKNADAFK